ncbi:hypothetical protein JL721_1765 [Aureococcus anophagefferens]|nr:hypothetical protein JL721_1765 [Aureococcus anophagefferens]
MYAIYDFLKAHGLKRSEERRERREFRRVMSFYESGRADAFDQDIEDRDLAHAHAVTLSKRIELSGDVSRDLLEETSAARPSRRAARARPGRVAPPPPLGGSPRARSPSRR